MINTDRAKKIEVLQDNLSSIRKIAGWTTEEFGEKIGVTKQTISNLENGNSKMNFTQYIAIRSVLDCEIEENKNNENNEVLASVVDIVFNHCENLKEDDYKGVSEGISTVAAAATGGVAGVALAGIFKSFVLGLGVLVMPAGGAIIGAVAGAAGAIGAFKGSEWLKKLLKSNKSEENK